MRFSTAGDKFTWLDQWRAVATLNANPDRSRNRADVRPRWNCHTLNHSLAWYELESRALDVWPEIMATTASERARSMKMTRPADRTLSFTRLIFFLLYREA
jgi:hypothetical protein